MSSRFDNFPGRSYKMAETGRELADDITHQPLTSPQVKVSPDILAAVNGAGGPSAKAIATTGLSLIQMLLEKNVAYGDSARDPISCFAQNIDTRTRMGVRMDDKISRLMRGDNTAFNEDAVKDLAGYLILYLSLED